MTEYSTNKIHVLFYLLVKHSGAVVGSELADWGEVQVRNSADFACGGLDTVCHLYGGINYQIEHHLFPSINHAHLPSIAPIIREGEIYDIFSELCDCILN
jgi:fatty acid desaturase